MVRTWENAALAALGPKAVNKPGKERVLPDWGAMLPAEPAPGVEQAGAVAEPMASLPVGLGGAAGGAGDSALHGDGSACGIYCMHGKVRIACLMGSC